MSAPSTIFAQIAQTPPKTAALRMAKHRKVASRARRELGYQPGPQSHPHLAADRNCATRGGKLFFLHLMSESMYMLREDYGIVGSAGTVGIAGVQNILQSGELV